MNAIAKLKEDIKKLWAHTMSKKTGICYSFLYQVSRGENPKKIRHVILDKIYNHYRMERDDFYVQNMMKWEKPTDSILGSFLRIKRIQKGYSVHDVAKILKWDFRQIQRIETWRSLPSYTSYYITNFFTIYEFTEDEKQAVWWYIITLRDLMTLYNKSNDVVKK